MTFQKATKKRAKLRLALIGPSGSGKTFTGLTLACKLGERVAVIDTERGSASKYADRFSFDVLELDTFSPTTYVDAIHEAEKAGYDVLVIDSLSHAWSGKDGALEQVDRAAKRTQSQNTFAAWREVTPQHNAMIDAIIGARMHIIATMRAKTEYVMETNERGKTTPRKVGIAPVQRDGMEYEFDVVADMDIDNNLIVSKSRCPQLTGAIVAKPNGNVADVLKAWLDEGAEPVELRTSQPPAASSTTQPPAQRPPASGNGTQDKPKLAANRAGMKYSPLAMQFAKDFPNWQNKNGVFDDEHIRASIAAHCNVIEITPDNIETVFRTLREYATEQAQLPL